MRGKVDVAFLRREAQAPGLAFKLLIKEPLAVLPTSHRLAARKEIRPQDIANEIYIAPTRVAPVLNAVLDNTRQSPALVSGPNTTQKIYRRQCHWWHPRAA